MGRVAKNGIINEREVLSIQNSRVSHDYETEKCTTDRMFDKIYVKAIRYTFLEYEICHQRRDELRHEGTGEDSFFWWGVTSKKRVGLKILGMSGEIPPQSLH